MKDLFLKTANFVKVTSLNLLAPKEIPEQQTLLV